MFVLYFVWLKGFYVAFTKLFW